MQFPEKPTQKEISKMIMIAYFGPRQRMIHFPSPTDKETAKALAAILKNVEEHIRKN